MTAVKLPKIAILILNRNGKHFLKNCFDSLKNQTYPNYEVVLVDNGSTDGSVEFVRKVYPWVKLIEFDRNYGFAKGYNMAIKQTQREYLVLLNNDTEVTKDWLYELVKPMLKDERVLACGSRIMFYDRRDTLQHAGIKITPMGGGYDIGYLERDRGQYLERPVGAVSGASMLVRRSAFVNLGGFDEDFFAYHEDTDFCWRAWLFGYTVLYVPTSAVYHIVGGTAGERVSSLRIFFGRRNRLMSLLKNFEPRNVAKALIITFLYDIARSFLFIRSRLHHALIDVFRAHVYILKNLRLIIVKRRLIQRQRVVSDDALSSMGLIATLRESISEFRKIEI
ncbi:MAG: glycosyltransferase family 2 protein [Candidatus Bathyarchaeia archaeon]